MVQDTEDEVNLGDFTRLAKWQQIYFLKTHLICPSQVNFAADFLLFKNVAYEMV
jgi:hypothetical protein